MSTAGSSPEGKPGKKPTGQHKEVKAIAGQEKAPEQGEVAGHTSPGAYYRCWNDAVVNYVPYGWDAFYCRRCYALNFV